MMIRTMLVQYGELNTEQIIEKIRIFNEDCVDNVPLILSQMRVENEVEARVDKELKSIFWKITQKNDEE